MKLRISLDVDLDDLFEIDSGLPRLTSWEWRQTAWRICWTHCHHSDQDPHVEAVHWKWNINLDLTIYVKAKHKPRIPVHVVGRGLVGDAGKLEFEELWQVIEDRVDHHGYCEPPGLVPPSGGLRG